MDMRTLFHMSLNGAAFVVCVTGLLFTFIQRRTEKLQNKLYVLLVSIVALNSLSMTVCEACIPYSKESDAAYLVVRIMDYLYFVLHTALCPLFFIYVKQVCGGQRFRWQSRTALSSLFVVTELLVILNPLFHLVYYYEDRAFTRSWGEYLVYVGAGVYLFLAVFKLLRSWKAVTAKRRTALIYFYAMVMIGLGIQFINIEYKVELFAEALALLGVMIAIESEDDRIDIDTGLYNRKALQADLNSYINSRRGLYVICIKVTNAEVVSRMAGSENSDLISQVISGYLKSVAQRDHIYNTNPDTFIILLPDIKAPDAFEYAKHLSDRFEKTWTIGDGEVLLNAYVMASDVPGRIKKPADAFYMADSPVPANLDKKVLIGSDLDYLLRRAAVEAALSRGLEQGYFEVFYQPTYYLSGERLHGAEALLRLHDSILGNVYPDEFIPIAEQIGLIDPIDDFVFREVCAFVKSGIPAKYGLECINVNLSVIECMRPDFVRRINNVAEETGIDKGMINFEITESIAASDYKQLSSVVSALKADGFSFSMDDYGTGYSNMQAIFSLDFDVVKIDKSILWSAESSELGRIILENSVRMIQQMKREILVEGVETREQIEMLSDLSVDYLQGYYFSKPIPKGDFIQLLEHQRR
ncbi:MAG: EAL domain-containing protein [Ruminococcus sp.]|nr:EAL domain-containing protein [Ruminococcus sp.]